MGERSSELRMLRLLHKKRRLQQTYADVVQKQKELPQPEPCQDSPRVLTTLMKVKAIRRKVARRASLYNMAEDYALSDSCEAAIYEQPTLKRLPYTQCLSEKVMASTFSGVWGEREHSCFLSEDTSDEYALQDSDAGLVLSYTSEDEPVFKGLSTNYDISLGDFLLIKVFGKKRDNFRLYVCKVFELDDCFTKLFYKRIMQSYRSVTTREEVYFSPSEVTLKLKE